MSDRTETKACPECEGSCARGMFPCTAPGCTLGQVPVVMPRLPVRERPLPAPLHPIALLTTADDLRAAVIEWGDRAARAEERALAAETERDAAQAAAERAIRAEHEAVATPWPQAAEERIDLRDQRDALALKLNEVTAERNEARAESEFRRQQSATITAERDRRRAEADHLRAFLAAAEQERDQWRERCGVVEAERDAARREHRAALLTIGYAVGVYHDFEGHDDEPATPEEIAFAVKENIRDRDTYNDDVDAAWTALGMERWEQPEEHTLGDACAEVVAERDAALRHLSPKVGFCDADVDRPRRCTCGHLCPTQEERNNGAMCEHSPLCELSEDDTNGARLVRESGDKA